MDSNFILSYIEALNFLNSQPAKDSNFNPLRSPTPVNTEKNLGKLNIFDLEQQEPTPMQSACGCRFILQRMLQLLKFEPKAWYHAISAWKIKMWILQVWGEWHHCKEGIGRKLKISELRRHADDYFTELLPLVAANVLDWPATIFNTEGKDLAENIVTNETLWEKCCIMFIRGPTLITVKYHVRNMVEMHRLCIYPRVCAEGHVCSKCAHCTRSVSSGSRILQYIYFIVLTYSRIHSFIVCLVVVQVACCPFDCVLSGVI